MSQGSLAAHEVLDKWLSRNGGLALRLWREPIRARQPREPSPTSALARSVDHSLDRIGQLLRRGSQFGLAAPLVCWPLPGYRYSTARAVKVGLGSRIRRSAAVEVPVRPGPSKPARPLFSDSQTFRITEIGSPDFLHDFRAQPCRRSPAALSSCEPFPFRGTDPRRRGGRHDAATLNPGGAAAQQQGASVLQTTGRRQLVMKQWAGSTCFARKAGLRRPAVALPHQEEPHRRSIASNAGTAAVRLRGQLHRASPAARTPSENQFRRMSSTEHLRLLA